MLEAAMIMRADAMICPPYTWTEVTMLPAQQMVTKKTPLLQQAAKIMIEGTSLKGVSGGFLLSFLVRFFFQNLFSLLYHFFPETLLGII